MNRFRQLFAERVAAHADLDATEVARAIATPPRPEMGQLAFPCFALAKARRRSPVEIAAEIAPGVETGGPIAAVSAAGPYVNATLAAPAVAAEVLPHVFEQGEAFGRVEVGQGRAVPVDFSSPNIAKPFGIHHLRSTVIGHALVGLLRAAGYAPVGINHIGDWGTQFGQLLAIWEDEGDEATLRERGIAYLLELYVAFNERKEQRPELQDRARGKFRELESGDPESRRLWSLFREVSLREFERVYARLGIRFDDVRGESFYEDRMPAVLDELEAKGLLEQSEGATIVDLEPHDLTPAMLRKADGSTLYITRDLAAADYRFETYGFARALYVVGAAQSLHFAQMKKVLELLGRDWHERIEHVPFGMMRFKDRKMATRTGDVVLLEEVLDRAVALARETIERNAREKDRQLPADLDEMAEAIGVGAVVFNDLKNRRVRDVVFDWDEVLSFEGETGPYLQYTAARIASLGDKFTAACGRTPTADVDATRLDGPDELALLLAIEDLPDALERAVAESEPSLVSDQLLAIAARFSTLYARRDWKVVGDDAKLSDARMALAFATRQALVNGLAWLGIAVPRRM